MVAKQIEDHTKGMVWRDVRFAYSGAKGPPLVDRLSFQVHPGEFVSLLGPSGCGKSTILRLAGGLIRPDMGQILRDGVPVKLGDRDLGFVFQDYGLFPWRNVWRNVELGLQARGMAKAEREGRVHAVLEEVQMLEHGRKYPFQLSGGMKQRTAIARVLATEAQYLLMDEPFGALDAHTRSHMQQFLHTVWSTHRKTTLLVTHSIEEALLLSDRIFLLHTQPFGGTAMEIVEIKWPHPRSVGDEQFSHYRQEITALFLAHQNLLQL